MSGPDSTRIAKVAPDTYERGTAYRRGAEAVDFDLDLQVIEYR